MSRSEIKTKKLEGPTLVKEFYKKFESDPLRFDSLPGISPTWNSQKLVELYGWTIQSPRPSQDALASKISVHRSSVGRKSQEMDWDSFADRLRNLLSMSQEEYIEQSAKERRTITLARIALHERRKEIDRAALQLQIREDIIKNTVPIEQIKLPPIKTKNKKIHTPEHMVLLISDMHVGQDFSLAETGFLNEFNPEVLKKRAANLRDGVVDIYKLHKELYKIPALHVFCMGDLVQGSNLGGEWGPAYNVLPVTDQTKIASETIAQMVSTWSAFFEEIHIYGLIGNHGRAGVAKNSDRLSCNWDEIVYTMLGTRLSNHKSVTVESTPCWWTVKDIHGVKFAAIHGDFVRGSLTALVSEYDRLSSMIPHRFQYLLMGHFHKHIDVETSKGRLIVNGSFVGGDIHSMHQLKQRSRPSQTVFGVHPEHGITWSYCLDLDAKR